MKTCVMIYGKGPELNKFRPFNYNDGCFEINLLCASTWKIEHKSHVQGLIDHMNKENEDYTFELREK